MSIQTLIDIQAAKTPEEREAAEMAHKEAMANEPSLDDKWQAAFDRLRKHTQDN